MKRGNGMNKSFSLSNSFEKQLERYFSVCGNRAKSFGIYELVLKEIEKPLLRIALEKCRGNQLKTAKLLGINRNTLRKKMRELGLCAGKIKQKLRSRGRNDSYRYE